ncbi:MAG TPA: type VI secretion system contractile sheath large subunit [Ideonella sp.]|nr:type VI secretion system contractile sheath large subunit [Ideonella sp.]
MSDWTPDFGQLERAAPSWNPKRPVRIALLGDFGAGAARGRLAAGADLAARKPIAVEFDSLDAALDRLDVSLTLPLGAAGAGVEMRFAELEAFHPDELYRNVGVFAALASLRQQLGNSATFAKAAAKVQSWSGGGRKQRASTLARKARTRGGAPAANVKLDDFARLVGRPAVIAAPDTPVDALLREVVAPFVVPAPDPKKDALVASVDKALTDAMRALLHHGEFKNLEALWRGVDFLLRRLETGPALQVHLVDLSAEEFAADLGAAADLGDSALYRLLVEQPAKEKNGGYALVCGLYQFEATPPHAELLGRMARIAAQADASFVTSIAPDAFADPRRDVHPLVADAWHALRSLPEAGRLAVATPRFMLRYPYGARTDPISSFAFEEFSNDAGLGALLWGHPALLVASLLAAPGGAKNPVVGELPFHHVVDADGDQVALPCTERQLSVDAAATLARRGLIALLSHKGQPDVRLAGLNAVNGTPLTLPGQVPAAASRGATKIEVGIGGKVVAKASVPAKAADDGAEEGTGADDDAGGGDSGDLDALLAGMGGDDAGAADASASEEAPAEETASGDAEMDPELAALLKSLE